MGIPGATSTKWWHAIELVIKLWLCIYFELWQKAEIPFLHVKYFKSSIYYA